METTLFEKLAESNLEYLSNWYLDMPVIINSERYNSLKRVQEILFKAINYFVRHFDRYDSIFPISPSIKRIVDLCSPYPYRIGTYRPDFLLTGDELKICEIGARFPLNGYFLSGISEYLGIRKYNYKPYLNVPEYSRFIQYLFESWGEFKTLYVLKGNDRPCDIKYYVPYFEEAGIKVEVFSPEQLSSSTLDAGCRVVNEFNQMEMEKLDDDILKSIAATRAINDMRTIFLIHDKRFLAVLSDKTFLSEAIEKEEVAHIQPYLIKTYTSVQHPEIWEEAKADKDSWVIKNALLGKSEQVYTGRTSTREEWERLFSGDVKGNMVLQPYINQKQISSSIKDKQYKDYVAGTILCFDNRFFGAGIFRTSSFEITNRVDDRKMCPCFTDDCTEFKNYYTL